ncbi:MAG: FliO/MopB family protein [Thermoleophilaceae bacterium]|nr:FliO/MopB family protein [Thermoleophilaceae bacterium]
MVPAVAVPAMLVLSSPAFAARTYGEDTPLHLDEQQPVHAAAGGGGSLVRTFVGLAIVLAVIYGLYWLLKQVKASREERASGTGLATIATLPLGPNRSLHMVKTGPEVVLLGVAEHGVTPIRSWSEAEARQAGFLDETGAPPAARPQPWARVRAARGAGRQSFPTVGELIDELRRRTVRK